MSSDGWLSDFLGIAAAGLEGGEYGLIRTRDGIIDMVTDPIGTLEGLALLGRAGLGDATAMAQIGMGLKLAYDGRMNLYSDMRTNGDIEGFIRISTADITQLALETGGAKGVGSIRLASKVGVVDDLAEIGLRARIEANIAASKAARPSDRFDDYLAIEGSIKRNGSKAYDLDLNHLDSISEFGTYDIFVNRELYKIGKADFGRVTQSTGLPTRLHTQIRKLEQIYGEANVRPLQESLGRTTSRTAIDTETFKLDLNYFDTGQILPGNTKSYIPPHLRNP